MDLLLKELSSGRQMTVFSLQLILSIQSQILVFRMLPNRDFKVLMQTRDCMMAITATCYPSEASRVTGEWKSR